MNLEEKVIRVNKTEDLPSLQKIETIPRELNLKIVFDGEMKSEQEKIGEYWKEQLPEFLVGVHTNNIEVNICKLITDEEIIQNQVFFENCAKEYGLLAEQLINQFIKEFKVPPHEGFPLKTLRSMKKRKDRYKSKMGKWKCFFHGFHCAFTNIQTGQILEVPLTYGEEYGILDPYFFSLFIRSTPQWQPLPVQIYHDFHDGFRILKMMLKLEKFEYTNGNFKDEKGIVVKDRIKKTVKIFNRQDLFKSF